MNTLKEVMEIMFKELSTAVMKIMQTTRNLDREIQSIWKNQMGTWSWRMQYLKWKHPLKEEERNQWTWRKMNRIVTNLKREETNKDSETRSMPLISTHVKREPQEIRKGKKYIFEGTIAKNVLKSDLKTLIYRPKHLKKSQVGNTQGDPHLYTS